VGLIPVDGSRPAGDASTVLAAFAAEVGPGGPVCPVGGRTQWAVGGVPDPGVREVFAPSGVIAHHPAEMIVRVRAGTTLAELRQVLAAGGQEVALEAVDADRATVGGILSVGRSGLRRLGWGPVRDAVLEITAVSGRGELIRSGAPLVKNVTGFDLCRLLIGSLGTLAVIAEVVLRCRPRPEVEAWWRGDGADPFAVAAALYRPLAVLWDGTRTWVGLAGYRTDVDAQATAFLGGFEPVSGPPSPPGPIHGSWPPGELRRLAGAEGDGAGWLAEVGVGVVHGTTGATPLSGRPAPSPAVSALHAALKERFDPAGRLNPGRSPLAGGAP
jgi:glycolate oxidase FAD binding subunit